MIWPRTSVAAVCGAGTGLRGAVGIGLRVPGVPLLPGRTGQAVPAKFRWAGRTVSLCSTRVAARPDQPPTAGLRGRR